MDRKFFTVKWLMDRKAQKHSIGIPPRPFGIDKPRKKHIELSIRPMQKHPLGMPPPHLRSDTQDNAQKEKHGTPRVENYPKDQYNKKSSENLGKFKVIKHENGRINRPTDLHPMIFLEGFIAIHAVPLSNKRKASKRASLLLCRKYF